MSLTGLASALAALLGLMALPRLAQDFRGLGIVVLLSVAAGAAVWFGWAARLDGAVNQAVPLLVLLTAGLALAFGVMVRAVVLLGRSRGWPRAADGVLSLSGAVVFGIGFLRMFDVI